MGFFDKLVDAWSDWDFDWGKTREDFKTAGSNAWGAFLGGWAGTFNIAQSIWDDDLTARAALKSYTDALGKGASAVGSFGAGLAGIPVAKQLFGTFDWAQTELVKRPLAATLLMEADATAEGSPSILFDTERWKRAYNTTTYVTPGQAWAFNVAANSRNLATSVFGEPTEIQKRDILRRFPKMGVLAQDLSAIDPRDRHGTRRQYYDNPFLKGMSGTMDAAVTLFGDPTIVGSKFTMAAKTRYWSKTMGAAAVQKGRHIDIQTTGGYNRTKDFVANAPTEEAVRHTVFNNHYNGSTAASLLFWARKDQAKYEELGGTEDLYDLTWRALYGDEDAFNILAEDAPRIADTVGTKFANYGIGQLGKQYGLGDIEVDAQWDALRETREQAWVDAFANGHGLFGQLAESVKGGGLLTGQSAPQLRKSSQWRVGVHQWMRNAPPTAVGMWARRSQFVLPSSRTGRMLDLQNTDGAKQLRANLEHSRMSQAEVDKWVSAYGRANAPESRFAIYNAAENAALKSHTTHYDLSEKQYNDLLPFINRWRTGNRQVMSSSRRFMSADVRKAAEGALGRGLSGLADRLDGLANDVDDAVKRGQFPRATYHVPDEDGNLAVIPEDADISTTAPVLSSQHADVVPMMDWNVLENALWWNTKGGFGKGVYHGVDGFRAALDSMMSLWKISAILRPGYVWRALSDEIGRTWATMGAARSFMSSVGGVKNSAHNWSSRGRLVGEIVSGAVTRNRAAGSHVIDVDGDLDDVAAAAPVTRPEANLSQGVRFGPQRATKTRNDRQVYSSYERALGDGVLGVDDFLDRVARHGEAGTLSPRLGEVYHGRNTASVLDDKLYRRHMIDAALTSVDRGVYTSAAWQQSVLDTVQAARRTKAAGEVGKGLVVDPFTGTSPNVTWAKAGEKFSFGKTRILAPKQGVFESDDVYDYVADNMDDLLKPGSLLAAYQRPDGAISLSVAKVAPEIAETLAVKPSGGKRIKLPPFKREGRAYRDSGSATFRVNTIAGQVEIHGAFEGQAGDLFRAQTSSRGVEEAWTETLSNIEHARLMAKSGRWVDITPERPEYKEAWERAVNLQLANDPVAKQFLAGASVDDVIFWLHNTSPGRAYNAKMGPWQSRYAEQVQIVKSMVDTYVPINENAVEASLNLRKKVLAGKAKLDDFETVMNRDDMPRVHGASIEYATGKGPWIDWFRRRIDSTFKVLADLPNDKFVRHPFAADRYRLHVNELIHNRAAELKRRGNDFTEGDLHAIERQARSRANADVHKYLYESAASLDLAKAFRLFVPFGSAIGDSTTKWGVVLRENPHTAVQLWKLWTAPDKAGLVQDEDGNQLRIEDGKEVWYQVNPETGERVRIEDPGKKRLIVFRLPSWLGPEFAQGMQPSVRIDKDVFHTFLDMPTFGPLVSVPANEFALDNPEFADKWLVRKFILPFGPSEDWTRAGVPGNVRNLWETFKEGENSENFVTNASSIYMTEMVRHARGERQDPPTYEEARAKAADMMFLRFVYRFGGVSAQFQTPYQPYIDYYHTLQEQSRIEEAKAARGESGAQPFDADERFYDEMGREYFMLTAAVTRNTMGLPATIGAFNQYKKLRTLMERFPELSSLIAGSEGAGEWNRAVYEAQQQTEIRFGAGGMMRRRMPPIESWEEVQRRRGWIEYGRYMDAVHADMHKLGVTSLQQKAAAPIKKARDRWLKSHMFVDSPFGGTIVSPWFKDFSTFDTSKMTERLHNLRQIVQDPRIQGRDDMRGLVDYLHMREQFKQAMATSGFKTLDSKKARTLQLQWQRAVFGLKQSNLSFAALYDRWLTNDESLEAV